LAQSAKRLWRSATATEGTKKKLNQIAKQIILQTIIFSDGHFLKIIIISFLYRDKHFVFIQQ
jgi:hypothetical protein